MGMRAATVQGNETDRTANWGRQDGGTSRRGFRPSARSRARIAAGILLSLVAIGALLMIFATLDKRVPVLQVTRDVPAGSRLSADDLRVIEVSADSSLALVDAADLDAVVGMYAKVRMVSGALLALPALQGNPLVAAGSSVLAITVPAGELPIGLRERSQVQLVIPPPAGAASDATVAEPVVARVVGLPSTLDSVTGTMSLSVEVAVGDGPRLAAAKNVRVVLLDPGSDAATP
ncbi:MAG TPA: SAF domain-containing protein [Ilumatobacteraceae bacterium]|nr:SAF domain-containing protein [Ilumatobacteraceae bacterium]